MTATNATAIEVNEVYFYFNEEGYESLYIKAGDFLIDFFNFEKIMERTGDISWKKIEGAKNKWRRAVWRNPINGLKDCIQEMEWEVPEMDFSNLKISIPSYEEWIQGRLKRHNAEQEVLAARFNWGEFSPKSLHQFIEEVNRGHHRSGVHEYEVDNHIWKVAIKRLEKLKKAN